MRALLQRLLIRRAPVKAACVKLGGNVAVGGGIHFLVVDTVEDTKKTSAAGAEQVIQPLTKGWRQNLLGIALAYSRYGIGEKDAAPHNVHDIGQFRNLRVEESVGSNPGNLQDTQAKNPLVGEVMYRIHGGGIGKEGILAEDGMHPVWYDTRVPIIAVDNIRRPIQRPHCFQSSTAKQDEPLSIISITIDILTIEVARRIDHIDRNAITDRTLPDSGLVAKAIHIHIYGIQHCVELEPVRIYLPIARHRQAHIVTKHLERLWKRPYHIGQSTYFDKRHDLGSKDEHSERSFVLHEYCSCSYLLFRFIIARKNPGIRKGCQGLFLSLQSMISMLSSDLVAVAHQEVELDTCQQAHY